MSDMQFRAVRKRSNKFESEKATDSESGVRWGEFVGTRTRPKADGAAAVLGLPASTLRSRIKKLVIESKWQMPQRCLHASIFKLCEVLTEANVAVNWSKDVDQALVEAKKKTDPFCSTSAQRRREVPVLSWMPSSFCT